MKQMKILSLFDGISCARVALERAGIEVDTYYASEVDKYAMQISAKNYPDIVQLGSVTEVGEVSDCKDKRHYFSQGNIDLLIGGSPCQNLSMAGNGTGLDGKESKLFFEYVRILKEVKPKYFILENVGSMKNENRDKISEFIGIKPIMIDVKLVSAQDRKRYFWTNIPNVTLPEDRGTLLKDILEPRERATDITERMNKKVIGTLAHKKTWSSIRTPEQKSKTLTAAGQCIANSGATNVKVNDRYYQLTPTECERLQGLEDNYTEGVSNSQRYKMLGNAFNVDVVSWILSFIH